jgi:hypothetical protein
MARFVYVLSRDVANMFNTCTTPANCPEYYNPKPITKPGESSPAVYIVEYKTMMDEVVREIVQMAKPDGMKILRICGHGAPGVLKLGPGVCLFDITVDRFKALNGLFLKGGRIELHSCFVAGQPNASASGSAGWLTKLATYAGVRVLAGEIKQKADRNWDWEGPVHTFYPLGVPYEQDGPPEYERSTREQRQPA